MDDDTDPVIRRRREALRLACIGNLTLGMQTAPFFEPLAEWTHDGDGTVTARIEVGTGVVRIMELTKDKCAIGREGYPERVRIPL